MILFQRYESAIRTDPSAEYRVNTSRWVRVVRTVNEAYGPNSGYTTSVRAAAVLVAYGTRVMVRRRPCTV